MRHGTVVDPPDDPITRRAGDRDACHRAGFCCMVYGPLVRFTAARAGAFWRLLIGPARDHPRKLCGCPWSLVLGAGLRDYMRARRVSCCRGVRRSSLAPWSERSSALCDLSVRGNIDDAPPPG
eukprot:7177449-Prymnesium_polylepis.1